MICDAEKVGASLCFVAVREVEDTRRELKGLLLRWWSREFTTHDIINCVICQVHI